MRDVAVRLEARHGGLRIGVREAKYRFGRIPHRIGYWTPPADMLDEGQEWLAAMIAHVRTFSG